MPCPFIGVFSIWRTLENHRPNDQTIGRRQSQGSKDILPLHMRSPDWCRSTAEKHSSPATPTTTIPHIGTPCFVPVVWVLIHGSQWNTLQILQGRKWILHGSKFRGKRDRAMFIGSSSSQSQVGRGNLNASWFHPENYAANVSQVDINKLSTCKVPGL